MKMKKMKYTQEKQHKKRRGTIVRPLRLLLIILATVAILFVSWYFVDRQSLAKITTNIISGTGQQECPKELASAQSKPGWTDPLTGMEFVWIKPGCFWMGSPESEDNYNEERHYVIISEGYYLGKYEVTQAQWQKIMNNNPAHFNDREDYRNRPVEGVTFNEVQQFIERLNNQSDFQFNLPTEAQWEYAARAGTTTAYYWGDNIDCKKAHYGSKDCGIKETTTVGSFSPNAWGLYDMVGNVLEWTCSEYEEDYDDKEQECLSTDGTSYASFVLRGGSWLFYDPGRIRSAARNESSANTSNFDMGFRLSRKGGR